jgi:hypothetical protein
VWEKEKGVKVEEVLVAVVVVLVVAKKRERERERERGNPTYLGRSGDAVRGSINNLPATRDEVEN